MPKDIEPGRLAPSPSVDNSDDPHGKPPDPWNVPGLVNEFRQRLLAAFPHGPDLMDSRSLTVILHMVRREYGLTATQVRTAMDQFFRHRLATSYDKVSPTHHFLAFLKDYIFEQPKFRARDWDNTGENR